MRVTQRQRFERRIKEYISAWRWQRCFRCNSEVQCEPMWRIYIPDHYRRTTTCWCYLCIECAPTKSSALRHWLSEEERS